ncbi:hypothetical protein FB107DRAFT_185675, partial [Schizophyllum commune]
MCTADRAYYGVYTPSCPIQPDSLRNRVHGAATCSSSLGKDDLISYESGLGKRKANAIEFAHYLEGLAKEMQPVLDTLVRATVADDERAPEAWQFALEMQKHAHSLKEARSHSDLSFAHVAASRQCARAVGFYRRYRKQAEDLLRATPQPELAQRATNPPASNVPLDQHHSLSTSRKRPWGAPDPSICAEARPSPPTETHRAPNIASGPLRGLPAEGEEVERGLPARAPPRKDEVGFAREVSGDIGSATRLVAESPRSSRSSTLARTMNEALLQGSHAQQTPSEAATPRIEALRNAPPLVRLRSIQAGGGDQGGRLSISARTRSSLWQHECPPHLIRRPRPVLSLLSPVATVRYLNSPISVAERAKWAFSRPVQPAHPRESASAESDISAREDSRVQGVPWSKMRLAAHPQRRCLSSRSPASALGLVANARKQLRATTIPYSTAKGRTNTG